MKIYTLDMINIQKQVYVHSLDCNGHIRRRLLDLGICSGTPITPIFRSITGDSTAYIVRGSTIAIRNDDAKKICVILNK